MKTRVPAESYVGRHRYGHSHTFDEWTAQESACHEIDDRVDTDEFVMLSELLGYRHGSE